jgi:hypothetical protein
MSVSIKSVKNCRVCGKESLFMCTCAFCSECRTKYKHVELNKMIMERNKNATSR